MSSPKRAGRRGPQKNPKNPVKRKPWQVPISEQLAKEIENSSNLYYNRSGIGQGRNVSDGDNPYVDDGGGPSWDMEDVRSRPEATTDYIDYFETEDDDDWEDYDDQFGNISDPFAETMRMTAVKARPKNSSGLVDRVRRFNTYCVVLIETAG